MKRHLSRVHKANKDGSALIPGQPVINTVENDAAAVFTQANHNTKKVATKRKTKAAAATGGKKGSSAASKKKKRHMHSSSSGAKTK